MSTFLKEYDRVVIPRWRDFPTTLQLGELAPPQPRKSVQRHSQELQQRTHEWRQYRTLPFATDLVSVGMVGQRDNPAVVEAAHYILENVNNASPAATMLAKRILGHPLPRPADASSIKHLRAALYQDPRNTLLWVELARWYARLGRREKAIRAMRTALALAPNARYVLRSAARMFVHFDEPEEGYWVLKRSLATPSDPWLISAETAVASILGRPPRLHKAVRNILENDDFSDYDLAELRSAIGTVDLREGNVRKARKALRAALAAPTDNVVAQVEWASRRVGEIDVDQKYLTAPYSFEARAWGAYIATKWEIALAECRDWLNDEPFSRRAAILGTHVAAGPLCNYAAAAEIATDALRANPKDQTLLNNLAFALASANRILDARTVYCEMDRSLCDADTQVCWLATGGLLRFREGAPDEGRALYLQAIKAAGSPSTSRLAITATLYLAREEALAHTPETLSALERARNGLKEFHGDFPQALVATFEKILAGVRVS